MKAKKFILSSLLLLTACQSRDPWNYQAIKTGSKEFDCAKLIFQVEEPFKFELFQNQDGLIALIHASTFLLPSDTPLIAKTEEENIVIRGHLQRGRERYRISEQETRKLIELLLTHDLVTLQIGQLEQTLSTKNFQSDLKKINR